MERALWRPCALDRQECFRPRGYMKFGDWAPRPREREHPHAIQHFYTSPLSSLEQRGSSARRGAPNADYPLSLTMS